MNDKIKEALRVALSGALTGGVLGAGGKFLGGARKLGQIGKAGAVGAGIGGVLSGASNLVGSELMGDNAPSSEKGLVGGALTGAMVGGGLGGLSAAGKLRLTGESPEILRALSKFAQEELPLKNALTEYIAKSSPAIGAAVGAGAMGTVGGAEGWDEGGSYDNLMRELEEKHKERLRNGN